MTIEITEADIERAGDKVERLSHELDITNADHIVLWLETNLAPGCGSTIGYLACRIVEAHERALQAREDVGERDEPVAEIVLFGGDLKEVAWRKGKMPPAGTKLYAHATPAGPRIAYRLLAEALAWIENSNEPAVSLCADIRKVLADKGTPPQPNRLMKSKTPPHLTKQTL